MSIFNQNRVITQEFLEKKGYQLFGNNPYYKTINNRRIFYYTQWYDKEEFRGVICFYASGDLIKKYKVDDEDSFNAAEGLIEDFLRKNYKNR